jgi:PAS domain S-box-containing protein
MQRTAVLIDNPSQVLWGSSDFWRDSLFEALPDAVLVADDGGRYVAANPAACKLVGYNAAQLVNLSLWQLTPEGDRELGWQLWQQFLAAGRASGEYSLRRGDGTTIEVEFQAVAHVQPGYHLSVLRDVTERKRAERELNELVRQLQDTEEALNQSRHELEWRVTDRTAALQIEMQAHRRAYESANQASVQLRALNQRLITAEEQERRRLSRELHDSAGQLAVALQISLSMIHKNLPAEQEKMRADLDEVLQICDRLYEELRAVSHALRPPEIEELGLNETLRMYCQEFSRLMRLPVHYEGDDLAGLPYDVSITFYRFLQEALTNIVKHAQATTVRVQLYNSRKGQISLAVEDDGVGMSMSSSSAASLDKPGIGLLGMQERLQLLGGELDVQTWPGRGTRLTARYHAPVVAPMVESLA